MERVYNLGNYESVRFALEVEIEESDKVDFAPLKATIDASYRRLYGRSSEAEKPAIRQAERKELTISANPKSTFVAVCKAVQQGRVEIKDLRKYYVVSDETLAAIEKYNS